MKISSKMFFDYRFMKANDVFVELCASSPIEAQTDGYSLTYLRDTVRELGNGENEFSVRLIKGFPDSFKGEVGEAFIDMPEAYGISVKKDSVSLYGADERGLIYAAATLRRILEEKVLCELTLFDYPDKSVRGYRVYTPGRDSIDTFKHMIDTLVYYKYNSLIIEVGGAMEYKSHPEINEKWEAFCTMLHKSPDESDRIQHRTYSWAKNSIHADNGGGAYITQEQMKDIINYCREREISVIPEVPSLSHADYIVMAHPEINERIEDAYPDTCCPSNPRTYEILFDIIDEVCNVFEPEYLNIGHDEYYTMALCDRCKGKEPVDLYVGDIIKINDYLKQKNVKTMMWCEKLFGNVYVYDEDGVAHPVGGTGNEEMGIPRLAPCAEKIPRDVLLLQWYWSLCSKEDEKKLCDMGYKMVYGNFRATAIEDYRDRISLVDGGFVSNWGSVEEEYMQRNGQNYSLVTTAWIFWSDKYNNSMIEELHEKTKTELYNRYLKTLGEDIIELEHTTDYSREYKVFYDGFYIVPQEWLIGWHIVTYSDGTAAHLPVIYGYNIRCSTVKKELCADSTESAATADIEPLGATYPVNRDGKVFYKTAYINPHPEKKIVKIEYKAKKDINVASKYFISNYNK